MPVDDTDAIAGAMRRLAADPNLRHRLGTAARLHTDTVFTMDRFVGAYAALYDELIAARRGRP